MRFARLIATIGSLWGSPLKQVVVLVISVNWRTKESVICLGKTSKSTRNSLLGDTLKGHRKDTSLALCSSVSAPNQQISFFLLFIDRRYHSVLPRLVTLAVLSTITGVGAFICATVQWQIMANTAARRNTNDSWKTSLRCSYCWWRVSFCSVSHG